MNLRELGFVYSPGSPAAAAAQAAGLVTVPPTVPAIEAFALMCSKGVERTRGRTRARAHVTHSFDRFKKIVLRELFFANPHQPMHAPYNLTNDKPNEPTNNFAALELTP